MAESYMGSITKGAVTIDSFLGINTLPGCGVNEFKRMQNMTTDYYPVMSTRPERYRVKTQISGIGSFSYTVEGINHYQCLENGNGGRIALKCNLPESVMKKLDSVTVYCYAKRKSAEKYYKYLCSNITSYGIFINFDNVQQRDAAKAVLNFKTTTGAGADIENENDHIEALLVAASLQSNIVYQDGYFYYVKDNSLVRRQWDEEKEESLIPDIFEGECKVELSGTAVVVSPYMGVYYLSTGLIRMEGYTMPFYYDDVTVTCPETNRPSYVLTIKNPFTVTFEDQMYIDYVFVTKDGKTFSGLELYDGLDSEGNFLSTEIEILDSLVNTDLEEKQKNFADNCLSYKGDGNRFYGQLRDGIFSETDPVGYIEYTSELGFNPKFSILYNNRMFACNAEGDCVHSSVIGKPYDFTTLEDGEASADWIEVVSSGQFTGIAAFGGNVYYFKENCVHKLYGSSPSDWQLVMLPINGVEDGADKSVAVENDVCIYKSTDGFYIFDGLTSTKISGKLGRNTILPNENKNDCSFYEYSACIFKGKYYCGVLERITGKYTLYTYDINMGLWCAEEFLSDTGFMDLMRTNRDVYGVKAVGDYISFISLSSGNEFVSRKYATAFEWSVESGDMTLGYANNKYISKIQVRAEGDKGTKIYVKIIADQKENKSAQFEFSPDTLDSYSYSPKPIRCDNFRVLLSGTGQAKIYGITLTISEGSEIR